MLELQRSTAAEKIHHPARNGDIDIRESGRMEEGEDTNPQLIFVNPMFTYYKSWTRLKR